MVVQAKYYDSHHKSVSFEVGQSVLLSTANLRMKGVANKLKQTYVGPFRIVEKIGTQSYRLELPNEWRVHNIFHISFLKLWKESEFVQVSSQHEDTALEEPEDDVYEVEKILR